MAAAKHNAPLLFVPALRPHHGQAVAPRLVGTDRHAVGSTSSTDYLPTSGRNSTPSHFVGLAAAPACLLGLRRLRQRRAKQQRLRALRRKPRGKKTEEVDEAQDITPSDTDGTSASNPPLEGADAEAAAAEAAADAVQGSSTLAEESINELPRVGEWQKVGKAYALRPPPWVPEAGVVHFMGGAFSCAAPHWTYRRLLAALSERGLWVITTPVALSFNHFDLVAEASQSFEEAYEQLLSRGLSGTLPVYGAGHSLGALLTGLLSSGCSDAVPANYAQRFRGHILISYNCQTLEEAVPYWREVFTDEELLPTISDVAERLSAAGDTARQVTGTALEFGSRISRALGLEGARDIIGGRERVEELYSPIAGQLAPLLKDVSMGVQDFKPAGEEVVELLKAGFPQDTPVLLVRFADDGWDQTLELEKALKDSGREGTIELIELNGAHLLPNFNELPDLLDGTDVLGRGALGAESPLDAALLSTNSQLSKLVDACSNFIGSDALHAEQTTQQLKLEGLQADDLRHPLDKRQTKALEGVPGLAVIVRRLSNMVEQAMYLDNLSTSVQVGPKQYSSLNRSLLDACEILDIPEKDRPELYIRQNPVPNAYTLAVQGKRPFIVVHTALLDILSEKEIQAVLAHELGHLKCEHGIWLTAANVLLLGATVLPLPVRVLRPLLQQLEDSVGTWQRAAELSCDRAALLVSQEPWTPTSVLMKLSGGGLRSSGKEVLPREQLEAFLAQADKYDDARTRGGPLDSFMSTIMQGGRPQTHPIPVLRAREMRRWADSSQFRRILHEKGVEYNAGEP